MRVQPGSMAQIPRASGPQSRVPICHGALERARRRPRRGAGGGCGLGRSAARGAFTVEFVLTLIASMALFVPVGEFLRISMYDQALAQATHQAARAAAAEPNNADKDKCKDAIRHAFQNGLLSGWLFDRDEDGTVEIEFVSDDWPMGSTLADKELEISLRADEDLYDGDEWKEIDECGQEGSWIRVRAGIVIEPWWYSDFGLFGGGIRRQEQSWARNQA